MDAFINDIRADQLDVLLKSLELCELGIAREKTRRLRGRLLRGAYTPAEFTHDTANAQEDKSCRDKLLVAFIIEFRDQVLQARNTGTNLTNLGVVNSNGESSRRDDVSTSANASSENELTVARKAQKKKSTRFIEIVGPNGNTYEIPEAILSLWAVSDRDRHEEIIIDGLIRQETVEYEGA